MQSLAALAHFTIKTLTDTPVSRLFKQSEKCG
jgi:hypothetical protein